MSAEFIEIYSTSEIPEIEIIQSNFNHHGIAYEFFGLNSLYSSNIYTTGIDGARLMVDPNDKQRALQLLGGIIPEKIFNLPENLGTSSFNDQKEKLKKIWWLIALALVISLVIMLILLRI